MATRPARTTDQMWWFWQEVDRLEPQAQLSGTWVRKTGYHGDVEWMLSAHPSDYSIQRSADLRGPRDVGRAIDISYADARAGTDPDTHKRTIIRVTKRLAAAVERKDPRMYGPGDVAKVREVIGTLDGRNTVLCSFLRERVSTRTYDPNDSHLWHNHVSITTEYVNDPQTYRDLLDIMFGDLTEEDDMPLDAADKKWIQGELAKLPAGVWAYDLDPGPFAERVGPYEAGKTYAAGGLMFGADSGWKVREAIEQAFATLPNTVTFAVRAAAAEFGIDLTAEQLEQLAGRTADLTTQELIGAVTTTKDLPGQPAVGE